MVKVTARWNGKEFLTKYYRQSSVQTRQHFIKSVKFDIIGKHDLLEIVNENKEIFIGSGVPPYSDVFTYEIENIYVYGDIIQSDYFYEYKFESDDGKDDVVIIYNADTKRLRTDFTKEIIHEFRINDKIHIILPYEQELENFKTADTDSFYVNKRRFSMRNEDDVEVVPEEYKSSSKHDKSFIW